MKYVLLLALLISITTLSQEILGQEGFTPGQFE